MALALIAAVLVAAGAGGGEAKAADPAYFYCYAPNPETGTTYVSDVHKVGPVGERRRYGDDFAAYLRSQGKLREGGVAYCVMRATLREVDGGRIDLSRMTCSECAGAERLEDVKWPRGGKGVEAVLAGNGPRAVTANDEPVAAKETAGEPKKHPGVTVYVREDATDAIAVSNQPGGADFARKRTQERGGKWRALLVDEQCSGWGAVAYAQSGSARRYWVQLADTEFEAAERAVNIASRYAEGKGDGWEAGIVAQFYSAIPESGPTMLDRAIDGVKDLLKESAVKQCTERGRSTCMCVRG